MIPKLPRALGACFFALRVGTVVSADTRSAELPRPSPVREGKRAAVSHDAASRTVATRESPGAVKRSGASAD
jgi:hypothetical protein